MISWVCDVDTNLKIIKTTFQFLILFYYIVTNKVLRSLWSFLLIQEMPKKINKNDSWNPNIFVLVAGWPTHLLCLGFYQNHLKLLNLIPKVYLVSFPVNDNYIHKSFTYWLTIAAQRTRAKSKNKGRGRGRGLWHIDLATDNWKLMSD